jgi:TRAP transporter TAXI family solute receptor
MKRLTVVLLAAAPIALAANIAGADTFVRMLAGPQGGAWYPYGAKMSELFQKNIKGITTSTGPGGGVGNIRDVHRGNAELGWTFGHTAVTGFAGGGPFKGKKQSNIRFFANLYPGLLQMAVRKDSKIKSLKDIGGARISPGKLTFAGNIAFEKLIKYYGFTYDGIKKAGGTIHRVGFSDGAALLKDGHIDLMVAMTTAPNAAYLAVDFQPGFRLLPVDDATADKYVKANPGFIKTRVAKSAYTSLTADVPAVAAPNIIIINKGVSSEIAYQLAKVVWEHHADLVQVNKFWKNVHLASALEGAGIPVHPGVMKFYKEKGVMKK